jgi:hypothetical protein
MANETLSDLTAGSTPDGTELMYVVQGGNSRRLTALEIANAADAWATAAQGALADSATQPGDLATVATTGAYSDLSGLPTLGTAAATAASDYATAAQGTTANSALQPAAIGVTVQAFEAKLQSLSGLTGAADRLPYLSGVSTFALATFTGFARTLLDDADAATARATLGVPTTLVGLTDTPANYTGMTRKILRVNDAATAVVFRNPYIKPDVVKRRRVTAASWLIGTSAADNPWFSVAWAPELGLFAAVAFAGTGNRVMTSPDGITWTIRTSAADNKWSAVAWAPELGLFAAVAFSGTGNRVMTSPDGITWTIRTSAVDNDWRGIAWAPELGLFAAVADTGTGNRVMTSPDGITWTARTSAADNDWRGIAWAPELGLFAAVADTGTGNRVMTSPDGITWTARTSAADNQWLAVAWAPELGLFAAVAFTGTGNRVMTSTDGITWTIRTSAVDNGWRAIAWAPELGLFAAVANSGTGNRVMTSPDGITWTARTSAADNQWLAVAWAPELGLFAAVAFSGTGDRVMTSALPEVIEARGGAASLGARLDVIGGFVSPNAGPVIAGRFYDNSFQSGNSTTQTGVSGRVRLAPYFTSIKYDADQIGVLVSTAVASALGRIAIYGVDSTGVPDAKLFEGSSDLDFSTTGYKFHDLSATPFKFASGTMYWLGLITSSTASTRAISTTSCVNLGLTSASSTTYSTNLIRALTFADALPDPWAFVVGDYDDGSVPSIRMRAV